MCGVVDLFVIKGSGLRPYGASRGRGRNERGDASGPATLDGPEALELLAVPGARGAPWE